MPQQPLIAEDPTFDAASRPRIVIDPMARRVRFEWCHEPRSFLASGVVQLYECNFDDVLSVTDFLTGDRPGGFLRGLLAVGPLVHSHTSAADLASIFISTTHGRCRVFANWTHFDELRESLRQITPTEGRPPLSENPAMIPVFVVAMLAVVAGVVYLML